MSVGIQEEHVTGQGPAIRDYVVLLSMQCHWWKGRYHLPKDQTIVEISGEEVAKGSTTTPQARLLTDEYPLDYAGVAWKKRFQSFNAGLARIARRYGEPFPIRGVQMLPRAAMATVMRNLEDLQRNMSDTADEFVSSIDDVFEQIARYTSPPVWGAVSAVVPRSMHAMRAKFFINVVPVEMSYGSAEAVSMETLEAHHDIVRDAVRRATEQAVETMVAGPRAQLAEALANLSALVNRDGRVTAASFRPAREAIAKIRLFDFVANEELLETIKSLEHRLDITAPTTLDYETATSSGFAAALRSVEDEVTNTSRIAEDVHRFGRQLRSLDV